MKQTLKVFGFWAAAILLWELVLHVTVFEGISWRFLLSIGFSLSAAAVAAVLSNLLRRRNLLVQYVLLSLLALIYIVQLIYFREFGTLLSLAYVSIGGQAIGNFLPSVLSAASQSIPQLLLIALPFPALALLSRRGQVDAGRRSWRLQAGLAGGAAVLFLLALGAVRLPGRENNSPYDIYRSETATVDRQAEYFGILTAERLELLRMGDESVELSDSVTDLTGPEDLLPQEDLNIMPELDFEALNAMTEDENLLELNNYFASLTGTAKNQYTGMFQGYNLIVICAEAFSPYLIDPELTPTLYRLSTEGFLFKNFYNSFPSVTTNGEYSLCMGLMPDLSRLSFATSMDNYVPFCLGNRMRTVGVEARAYHNNIGTFYNRISTHTNMGYDFKAIGFGLDMERLTPSSDLVMMEKSVDDYIGDTPFMVHYMTYSGHAEYDFVNNSMSIKNQDRVADLDCSETLKAYYACQLELEDAMTYLLGRLEEAGVADRTVIVLTGDHYPYGMPDEVYQELAGEAVSEPFWRYRNSFICWNGGMEEPIVVEDYCCTQDILPTLLNLFALPYDSRLLTGTDVLSDSAHIALLQDGSFLTEGLIYDSDQNAVTWLQPEESFPEGYADQLIGATENLFSVASAILRTDYYRFAFTSLGLADTESPRKEYASYIDTAGTWYEEAVELLTGRGALTGTTSGNFKGGDTANRAALLAMLTRTLYLEIPEETAPYSDLKETDWYRDAVSAAWAAGLLPAEEESCRPLDPVTPEDALALLTAGAELAGLPEPAQWAEEALTATLALAEENGEDTVLLTRGAAAALVARLAEETD